MLKHIKYDLEFSNGARRKMDTELLAGSTLITGKNGRGKSLILEMFGYLLFGTQALRGIASDYKKMNVEGTVSIRGRDYKIVRTKSKADIFDAEGNVLVTSTSAVNQHITQLLGYNFDVFSISNWCAQGEIQALANMKPTERKAMIDNVSGLTQLDGLIEITKQSIKVLKASVSAVENALVKPLEPTKPEVARSWAVDALEEQNTYLSAAQQSEMKLNMFQVPLAGDAPAKVRELVLPEEPVPAPPPVLAETPPKPEPRPVPVFEREKPVNARVGNGDTQTVLDKVLDLQVNQFGPKYNKLKELYAGMYNRKQHVSDEMLALWRGNPDLDYWDEQLQQWRNKQSYEQLLAQGDVTCPSCQHRHPVAADALAKFTPGLFPKSQPPGHTEIRIAQEYCQLEAQYNVLIEELTTIFGGEPVAVSKQLEEIRVELVSHKQAEAEYARALEHHQQQCQFIEQNNQQALDNWQQQCDSRLAQHQQMVQTVRQNNEQRHKDWLAQCNTLRQTHQQAVDAFNVAQQKWEQVRQAQRDAEAELAELKHHFLVHFSPERQADARRIIEEAQKTIADWRLYDSLFSEYQRLMESYNLALSRCDNERAQIEDQTKAQAALVEIKARVKTYLIPSLNRVSSYLLSEMTGGEHSTVLMDENFEVFVDGQPLRTMSGSGKDITNLAIRIGLGRILTHKVLGMMLLDEVDQGMDDSRAAYTWECIERITPQIGQVLQVSHKELRAENRLVVM